jgi:hypothetical protein
MLYEDSCHSPSDQAHDALSDEKMQDALERQWPILRHYHISLARLMLNYEDLNKPMIWLRFFRYLLNKKQQWNPLQFDVPHTIIMSNYIFFAEENNSG